MCVFSGFIGNVSLPLGWILLVISTAYCSCPSGWLQYRDACYFSNDTLIDHQDAIVHCASLNSTLASIHSSDDISFLLKNIIKGRQDRYFWLGGRPFSRNVAEYTWMDRTEFNFTKWAQHVSPPEPNEYQESCSGLVLDGNGWMLDDRCALLRHPICKIWLSDVNREIDEQQPVHLIDRILRSDTTTVADNLRSLELVTKEGLKKLRNDIDTEVHNLVEASRKLKSDLKITLDKLENRLEANSGHIENYTRSINVKLESKINEQRIQITSVEKDLSLAITDKVHLLREKLERVESKAVKLVQNLETKIHRQVTDLTETTNRELDVVREYGQNLTRHLNENLEQTKSELNKDLDVKIMVISNKLEMNKNHSKAFKEELTLLNVSLADIVAKYNSEMKNRDNLLKIQLRIIKDAFREIRQCQQAEHENMRQQMQLLNKTLQEHSKSSALKVQHVGFYGLSKGYTVGLAVIFVTMSLLFGLLVGCRCKKQKTTKFIPTATFTKAQDGSQFVSFNDNLYENASFM